MWNRVKPYVYSILIALGVGLMMMWCGIGGSL